MTNEEKVLNFKRDLDKAFRAYLISELFVSAVEVVASIAILAFVLNLQSERGILITVAVIFIAVSLSSLLMVKLFFGSVSGMNKVISFRTRVEFVTKQLEDCMQNVSSGNADKSELSIAQKIYNDELNSLVEEMNNIKIKKS